MSEMIKQLAKKLDNASHRIAITAGQVLLGVSIEGEDECRRLKEAVRIELAPALIDAREIAQLVEAHQAELAATKAEQLDLERIAWALSHGWKVSRTLNCEDFEKGWAEWVDPKGFNYPVHFTNWAKNDLPPLTDELREAIDKARAVDKGGGA